MIEQETIMRIMEILSKQQLQCLMLQSEGHTIDEISKILMISTNTVKTHLQAGRKKLRD